MSCKKQCVFNTGHRRWAPSCGSLVVVHSSCPGWTVSAYPKQPNIFFSLVESLGSPFLITSPYFPYCPLAAFSVSVLPFICVSSTQQAGISLAPLR